jgi:rhodanese-related sulfurtransferase
MGDVTLRFLETPGHTPESLSVLVIDREKSETPEAVLTGDTLFIGDVGRPDLLGSTMSAAELAGMLYDSLHEKLLTLPDSVAVYPAHGAGSLCGRNISSETSSTIGQQRRFNYALQPMPREEFIKMMTTDLPEAPAYFSRDVKLNREGPGNLSELPQPPALGPSAVEDLRRSGAVVLDTRPAADYGTGHIPGSLNIGLGGQFASWAGALLAPEKPIVLVTEDEDHVEEARTRLARVGLENVAGYLAGGLLAWHDANHPVATTEQISVDELRHRLDAGGRTQLVDVRRPGEWQAGHIPQATHLPLNALGQRAAELDAGRPVTAICAGGYRSSIATSLLEQHGFRVINVIGGMTAWSAARFEAVA